VTGGKVTVCAGTADAFSVTTSRHVVPSSLACSTASGAGAAPKPRGPGSPTVTERTVTGASNSCSIHADDQASGSRGSRTAASNEPSVRGATSSISADARTRDGESASWPGSAGNATTRQSTDHGARAGAPHRAESWKRPATAGSDGRATSTPAPPSTVASDQTTFFMASPGSTHGPPDALQPDDVATANSRPRSAAVVVAVSRARAQASVPGRTASGTTSGTPMPPSKS
jgi:hypothetical protein